VQRWIDQSQGSVRDNHDDGQMLSVSRVMAVGFLVALASCADVPQRAVESRAGAMVRDASVGYAIGRIQTVEDGVEKTHRPGLFPVNPFDVYLRSASTGRVERRELDGDGSFVWPLAPGVYEIAGFQAYAPLRVGRVWASFTVADAGRAVYVGTLRLELSRAGHQFRVEDRYAEAVASLRPKLPADVDTPAKALMTPDPPLGGVSPGWSICAERSGLVCDRSLQGVAVIQPVGSEQGAPLVDSLTPRLEWRPAPRAGLTYDVAVYESIVLNPMPGATRTLRGPVAAYAQALAEPHWQVSPPLPADRRYEWSVRLREGDNVSTWSTTGYFAFFVVGFASGSGNWFGFTTPTR
jgi:hypothetical protein